MTTHVWTHLTLTWLKDETFTVYRNLVGKFRAVHGTITPWASSLTQLRIGCTPNHDAKYTADDLSIADVVFWDRRLSPRVLMDKYQCSEYRFGRSRFYMRGLKKNSAIHQIVIFSNFLNMFSNWLNIY